MVKSDYFLSPQEYLEIVTGKTFIISGDNDCEYIERQLEKEGLSKLWSFPLSELTEAANSDIDIVLVDCMYEDENDGYCHTLRWFELPTNNKE